MLCSRFSLVIHFKYSCVGHNIFNGILHDSFVEIASCVVVVVVDFFHLAALGLSCSMQDL